ncbi:hypothetical protein HanRHA438_Chr04g0187751 [Helianthus annuus]|uniref:Uncharacterized protein n=1 Tax=Helianthus annuus TaxID=4232 RepID=A0A251V0A6_HELAN|nr:hypothetical protein HanXRQr2_Chr04g0178111 [Helianthus annuus]KAJ0589932.1 hypothetical protein HanIR_Chr04g0191811 [Helianthus annuus]KAJ0927867.1 hypothetical protein HanRHA438_Chr04g0187751 [Helianthus annuus]KAJ0932285.1 hypothetical protein HanPSC8_Chr04g0171911 [Helianthus annuus]
MKILPILTVFLIFTSMIMVIGAKSGNEETRKVAPIDCFDTNKGQPNKDPEYCCSAMGKNWDRCFKTRAECEAECI